MNEPRYARDITKLLNDDDADALGVARFAHAMREKLAEKRGEGRGGWNRPSECSISTLQGMLEEHVGKGDPVDVGNFGMMIWNRQHPNGLSANESVRWPFPVGTPTKALDVCTSPIDTVLAEVQKAVAKFPTWPTDPLHALAVLGEEFGELTKEVLQLTYEAHKTSAEKVRTEAIQTAAMALRFLQSLDTYRYQRGEQHVQGGKHAAIAE